MSIWILSSSTCDAVINFTNHIYDAFDKQNYTLAVFIDPSKAFETVNHKICLDKLEHNDIRGTLKNWFKSYLCIRQQFVSFNKSNSSLYIQHWALLGCILFALYINCIVKTSSFFNIILYADDSIMFVWLFYNCPR